MKEMRTPFPSNGIMKANKNKKIGKGSFYFQVPLEGCAVGQTCNAHIGGCSTTPVPECDGSKAYTHSCEQVSLILANTRDFPFDIINQCFPRGRSEDGCLNRAPMDFTIQNLYH